MANILITTTPLLPGIEIKRYIGPLTANVVLGVNFFSDFAASITDVFGGNSDTYQEKLDILTDQVGAIIKNKAMNSGANAVIDYKLSFNEISGKGKQMFMVTATGTACTIVMPKDETIEIIGLATYAQIRRQYLISLFKETLEAKKLLPANSWENILSLNLAEIADPLTKEYIRLHKLASEDWNIIQYQKTFNAKYEEYLSRLNKDFAAKTIYPYLQEAPDFIISLAVRNNLFSAQAVIELLDKGETKLAIQLLNGHKETYSADDLRLMKEIIAKLDSLPDKGHYQNVKTGMFSKKEEEMYICPNGHKSPKETTKCPECGLNIKGLTSEQDRTVANFKGIVAALETILNQ